MPVRRPTSSVGGRLAVEDLEAGDHPVGRRSGSSRSRARTRGARPRATGARGSSARRACRWRRPRSGCAARRRRRRRRRCRAPRSRASTGSTRIVPPGVSAMPSSGFRNERSGCWPIARMQASAGRRDHVALVVARSEAAVLVEDRDDASSARPPRGGSRRGSGAGRGGARRRRLPSSLPRTPRVPASCGGPASPRSSRARRS